MRSNPCIISVKIPFDAFIIKSDKWCVGVLVGGLEEHRGGSASGRRSFAVDDADHCYGEQDSEQHGQESQIIVEELAFQIRQEGAEEVGSRHGRSFLLPGCGSGWPDSPSGGRSGRRRCPERYSCGRFQTVMPEEN